MLEPPGIEINVDEKEAKRPMESVAIQFQLGHGNQIDRLTEQNRGTYVVST